MQPDKAQGLPKFLEEGRKYSLSDVTFFFLKQEQVFKNEGPPGEISLGKTSELGEEGLWGIKKSTGAANAHLCQKWENSSSRFHFPL